MLTWIQGTSFVVILTAVAPTSASLPLGTIFLSETTQSRLLLGALRTSATVSLSRATRVVHARLTTVTRPATLTIDTVRATGMLPATGMLLATGMLPAITVATTATTSLGLATIGVAIIPSRLRATVVVRRHRLVAIVLILSLLVEPTDPPGLLAIA